MVAASGKRDELVAKFIEATEIQRDNPACEVMVVSVAPDQEDVVYLTEVWASTEDWDNARNSDKIQAWAASMPELVDGPPESQPLKVLGGKGLRRS